MHHEILRVPSKGATVVDIEWFCAPGADVQLHNTLGVARFSILTKTGATWAIVDDLANGFMHSEADVVALRAEVNTLINALVDLDVELRDLLNGTQLELFSEEDMAL